MVQLPTEQLVGIKCTVSPSSDCKLEYDMAQHEASVLKNVLAFKADLESGKKSLDDKGDIKTYLLDVSEDVIQSAIKSKIVENKKSKLSWLKIESNLLQYDSKIKASLALDKANPREALKYMELMLKLEVDPLMLRKHPHVMDMVKRLRKYVGNVKEWDMKGDELEEFLKDAETIRMKADDIYLKFKVKLCSS